MQGDLWELSQFVTSCYKFGSWSWESLFAHKQCAFLKSLKRPKTWIHHSTSNLHFRGDIVSGKVLLIPHVFDRNILQLSKLYHVGITFAVNIKNILTVNVWRKMVRYHVSLMDVLSPKLYLPSINWARKCVYLCISFFYQQSHGSENGLVVKWKIGEISSLCMVSQKLLNQLNFETMELQIFNGKIDV